jgi:hypothetical protein
MQRVVGRPQHSPGTHLSAGTAAVVYLSFLPHRQMTCCASCSKAGATLRCSRCKAVYYCSTVCQHGDWKRHKASCANPCTMESSATSSVASNAVSVGAAHSSRLDFPIGCPKPVESDFSILREAELGRGNYSMIYRALLKRSGRMYAIKRVDKPTIGRLAMRHPSVRHEVMQEKHVGLLLGAPLAEREATNGRAVSNATSISSKLALLVCFSRPIALRSQW